MRSERPNRAGLLVIGAAVAVAASVGSGCRNPGNASEGDPVEVAVHVGPVTRATLHRSVQAYGRIEPEPAGPGKAPARAVIGAPAAGLLTRIECSEGEKVRRGATLFMLDSRAAEVAVATAQTALAYAEKKLERQRELLEAGGTSQRALEEAEQQRDTAANDLAAARTQLDLLHITSPVSGTVVRIDAALGQPVEPNTVLAEVIDLDRLVVSLGVPSGEAPHIEPGQRVELAHDSTTFGRVVFIGRDVDPATDTVFVRASIPPGSQLRPGQFLEFRIVTDEHPDCLVVPEASVITQEGEGSWVVVVNGDTAVRKAVTTGLREHGLVEVSGPDLTEGTVIVTEDAYGLPEKARVRIVGN